MPAWILPAIMGASSLFSALGKGKSDERASRTVAGQHQDALRAHLFGTQQNAALQAAQMAATQGTSNANLDLLRRAFALNAPSARTSQAVRGSLLQHLRPATMTGGSARLQAATPMVRGGLIDALGPGARDAGRLLESGALAGLRSGDTFDALPTTDFQGARLPPPTLTPYRQPGTGESILGLLGLIGPLLEPFRTQTSIPTIPTMPWRPPLAPMPGTITPNRP